MATKTKSAKPKTYHQGANDERTAVLAKVRRLIRDGWSECSVLDHLEEWLLQRNERYKAKAGGL
jgi:hypothetical protein